MEILINSKGDVMGYFGSGQRTRELSTVHARAKKAVAPLARHPAAGDLWSPDTPSASADAHRFRNPGG